MVLAWEMLELKSHSRNALETQLNQMREVASTIDDIKSFEAEIKDRTEFEMRCVRVWLRLTAFGR